MVKKREILWDVKQKECVSETEGMERTGESVQYGKQMVGSGEAPCGASKVEKEVGCMCESEKLLTSKTVQV